MSKRCMYSSVNVRGLRGTEIAYNSVDITSYAAFVNSLTEEEKKRCDVIVTGGDFGIIGVRLCCDDKKDIDIFNKIVEKAGNMLKVPYLDNRRYMIDEWNDEDDED